MIVSHLLRNFASIKAMAERLGGKIERLKRSPLRTAMRSDDIILHGNKVMIAK